jgi:hypothetical protein
MKIALGLLLVFVFAGIAAAQAPTFNRDIAPILYQNCVTCHRPGEVAPFSLLTYEDAVNRASLIAAVTKARYMPPWKAEPVPHFLNERRLTDQQIALIQAWVSNKTPEGDPATKPTPPAFPQGWQLGEPDRVFSLSEQYAVPAEGPDQFRCFVIPLNLDRDVYVRSVEFRPGNSRVVHHSVIFTDPTGASRNCRHRIDRRLDSRFHSLRSTSRHDFTHPEGNQSCAADSLSPVGKEGVGPVFHWHSVWRCSDSGG